MRDHPLGVNIFSAHKSVLGQMIADFLAKRGLEVACFLHEMRELRQGVFGEASWLNELPEQNPTFVIVDYNYNVDQGTMETLRALKALQARRCYAVFPFFPTNKYGRGDPVAHRDVEIQCECMQHLGCLGIASVELDVEQVPNLFFKNLSWQPILAEYLLTEGNFDQNTVVMAPSWVTSRYQELAAVLSLQRNTVLSFPRWVFQPELKNEQMEYTRFLETFIPGRKVVVVDFVLNTGGTVARAVRYLRELRALEVTVALPHLVMDGTTVETLQGNLPDRLIVSNTTGQEKRLDGILEYKVLDIVLLLVEAIEGAVRRRRNPGE